LVLSQLIVYTFKSPGGKKFRSGKELKNYFIQTKSPYNYEDFGFTVRRKNDAFKVRTTPIIEKKKAIKSSDSLTARKSSFKLQNEAKKVQTTPIIEKKKEIRNSDSLTARKSSFKETLNSALNITKGWTRKLVQRSNNGFKVYVFRYSVYKFTCQSLN